MSVSISVKIEKKGNPRGRRLGPLLPSGKFAARGRGGARHRLKVSTPKTIGGILGGDAAVGFAAAIGSELKERTALRGKTVDTTPGTYDIRRGRIEEDGKFKIRPFLISPKYKANRGAKFTTKDGVTGFDSSKTFHARQGLDKPGKYRVTGGMWKGLSVVPRASSANKSRADLLFRGRSEGQRINWGTDRQREARQEHNQAARVAAGKRRLGRLKPKGRKVSNALKAGTVASSHGVHLLRITNEERRAMQIALELMLADAIWALSDGEMYFQRFPSGGNRRVVKRIIRAVNAVASQKGKVK